jgi:hypothetical protein
VEKATEHYELKEVKSKWVLVWGLATDQDADVAEVVGCVDGVTD